MNRVIAMYLPQYHPTEDNNKWWGKGFTEWTNVAKARKLYPGHYQPKIPTELGFYDLRLKETRQAQADLAKEAGVHGFCYYHYWFGNGKKELELPFEEVVKTGEPDFPFCLCWANETWHKKFWDKDGKVKTKVNLVEQLYPGVKDNEEHFNYLLSAFKDPRYIKVDGKLLFMIYRPLDFNEVTQFMEQWRNLAIKNDLPDFYFICFSFDIEKEYNLLKGKGFDGIFSCPAQRFSKKNLRWVKDMVLRYVFMIPVRYDFRRLYKKFMRDMEKKEDVYPLIIPNWDHTPRSTKNGYIFSHTNPEVFEKHVEYVLDGIKNKTQEHKICFLKAWNEWGEGNYMEPDIKYGRGFIDALRRALTKYE